VRQAAAGKDVSDTPQSRGRRGEMIGSLFKRFFFALVLATASVANVKSADTLTYDNILGKWCGAQTNPNWVNLLITRDALTITHLPNKVVNKLSIDHFEFTDTTAIIHYFAAEALNGVAGKNLFRVSYGDFGADGKSMVQLSNSVQPRDAYYKRC
jgi:hypothetical protein